MGAEDGPETEAQSQDGTAGCGSTPSERSGRQARSEAVLPARPSP